VTSYIRFGGQDSGFDTLKFYHGTYPVIWTFWILKSASATCPRWSVVYVIRNTDSQRKYLKRILKL